MRAEKVFRKLCAGILSAALITAGSALETNWNSGHEPFSMTVQAASAERTVEKIDASLIRYGSMPFVCSDQNGIYLVSSGSTAILKQYDPKTKKTTTKKDFGYCSFYIANDKVYTIGNDFSSDNALEVSVYNVLTGKTERTIHIGLNGLGEDYWDYPLFAVDSFERVYLLGAEGKTLYLFDKTGKYLSKAESNDDIYDFVGFDSANGNFYVTSCYNYSYWGYDHAMSVVRMGNVKNNKISLNDGFIDVECQQYFFEYPRMAELIGDKYLCMDSTFSSRLLVYDSNKLSVNDELTDGIMWIIDGGGGQWFETSTLDSLFSLDRDNSFFYDSEGYFNSGAAVGVRCVYLKKNNSFLASTDSRTIKEYNINNKKEQGGVTTKYPIYTMLQYGDGVAVIEKSGSDYYLEIIPWTYSTRITLDPTSKTMKIGSTAELTAKGNGTVEDVITWKSSNAKVASVTQSGKVIAWSKGSAAITAENSQGIKASCQITVSGDSVKSASQYSAASKGKKGDNISANNYDTYGSVVNSYIQENSDGSMSRIEPYENSVLIETYKDNGKTLTGTKTVKKELSLFGGFYSGKSHNYLVFGQSNTGESDTREVLRIVKYDKSWKRISSVSVKGANTFLPFDAGSLRMEEAGDLLYVYTCHEMYTASDGYNHQSNMTFVVDEKTMKLKDSYYDVMNIGYGYISHSFNQFIKSDGKSVFRADHGDASPRGVSITKIPVGGSVTDVLYNVPVSFDDGEIGNNYTGASVGGFELSTDNCIIAGNGYRFDDPDADLYGTRNIFVNITGKDLEIKKTKWLTNYTDKSNVSVSTPQLVKINDEIFLIMWEETTGSTRFTKLALMDSEGNLKTGIIRSKIGLSDCQPVRFSDGLVRWYVSDNGSPVFYTVNPFDLKQVEYVVRPTSVTLNNSQMSLGLGETVRLSAAVYPSNAYDKSVKWRTSSSKVLTVDQQGNVKTVGTGTAWVTVRTSNGLEKSCKITVKNAPSKITLTKGILTLGVGEKYSVGSGVNDGAACSKRTYRTSNSSIVKMTRTDWIGDFVAVRPGVAWVTVRTYNGKESTCRVTVKAAPSNVRLNKKEMTMKVGQKGSLSAIIPYGTGCATRTFRSSNNNVVKMTKTNWTGEFTAKNKGIAYVAVKTYNGKEAYCKITVQ